MVDRGTEAARSKRRQVPRQGALVVLGALWGLLAGAKILSPEVFEAYVTKQMALPSSAAWWAISIEILLAGASFGGLIADQKTARWLRGIAVWGTLLGCAAALMAIFMVTEPCGCFGKIVRATQGRRLIVIGAMVMLCGVVGMPPIATHAKRHGATEMRDG